VIESASAGHLRWCYQCTGHSLLVSQTYWWTLS